MEAERQRAEMFLHPTLVSRLIEAGQQVLVDYRLPSFRHEFDRMLRSGDDDGKFDNSKRVKSYFILVRHSGIAVIS